MTKIDNSPDWFKPSRRMLIALLFLVSLTLLGVAFTTTRQLMMEKDGTLTTAPARLQIEAGCCPLRLQMIDAGSFEFSNAATITVSHTPFPIYPAPPAPIPTLTIEYVGEVSLPEGSPTFPQVVTPGRRIALPMGSYRLTMSNPASPKVIRDIMISP